MAFANAREQQRYEYLQKHDPAQAKKFYANRFKPAAAPAPQPAKPAPVATRPATPTAPAKPAQPAAPAKPAPLPAAKPSVNNLTARQQDRYNYLLDQGNKAQANKLLNNKGATAPTPAPTAPAISPGMQAPPGGDAPQSQQPTQRQLERYQYLLDQGRTKKAEKFAANKGIGATTPTTPEPEISPPLMAPNPLEPAPATPTPGEDIIKGQPVDPPGNSMGDALFPSMRAFEPENYEGSPLYQWQADEGQKRLERLYAARGLTNSGAEIEGNRRFLTELGAMETDKTRGYAQNEADRAERLMQNEVLRQEREKERYFNQNYQLLNMLFAQNPMDMAYDATGNVSKLRLDKNLALADLYNNQAANLGGGGGGGGAPTMPYIPPMPTGPSYDAAQGFGATSGAAGNMDYMNAIINGIGGLFG